MFAVVDGFALGLEKKCFLVLFLQKDAFGKPTSCGSDVS